MRHGHTGQCAANTACTELPALSSSGVLAHGDATTGISGGNEFHSAKAEQIEAPLPAGDMVRRRKGAKSPHQPGSFPPAPRRRSWRNKPV